MWEAEVGRSRKEKGRGQGSEGKSCNLGFIDESRASFSAAPFDSTQGRLIERLGKIADIEPNYYQLL